jgi:acyl-CoA thioesterase FadM
VTEREPDVGSWPYRVRFDEAGPDAHVRVSVLLRYTQDLASYHSAARGFDRAWYAERGLVWLVRAAEVAILEPIAYGDDLVGSTRVVGWRRVWARRRTEFTDGAGVLRAWVHIDWVLLDQRFRPTRIPEAFRVFGAPEATFPLARVDLGAPPDDAAPRRFEVRPQELDPMDHANNAVYADWLDEAVIAAGGIDATRAVPRLARLEYAQSAERGATVEAIAWPVDDGWSSRVTAGGNELLRARLETP